MQSVSNIVVVGSYVVDLMSRTPHMPQPGETVLGGPFKMGPGGKGGNQAVAAARQGAKVTMVTKLGEDELGKSAYANFVNEGINAEYITFDPVEATGAALITVDNHGENMIVVALGACGKLTDTDVSSAEDQVKQADVMLVQLETSMQAVEKAIELAEKHARPIILNPAPYQPVADELLAKVTYITPNETEASQLTGIMVNDIHSAEQAARALYQKGIKTVLITLGKSGCLIYTGEGNAQVIPGYKVEAIDTTGAGDAFNGGFAYALSIGHTIEEAVKYANAVAALSVTKVGTSPAMPTREEVEVFMREFR